MYSPQFMRFLVGRDADDFTTKEKNDENRKTPYERVMYRYARYATVPIEIKK